MFKVNISNASQNLSWSAKFPTELEAQEWLSQQIGKPDRLPEREVPTEELDEQGNPIMELLPAEFTSEIIDISAQINQENINKQAKELLANSDWKVLRHIRQKALNQPTTLSEQEYLALEQQRADAANSIVEN